MARPKVAIILRHGLGTAKWLERFDRGEKWDRTPYGYDRASSDFDLIWSRDSHETAFARVFRSAVRRVLGFDLVHVWRNRDILKDADVVWTHTEREHLAVATLKQLFPRTYGLRSIAQSVWLWDNWAGYSVLRRWLYRRLLAQHDIELVLSRSNRDIARRQAPGRRVESIPFGSQGVLSSEGQPRASGTTVLAVGNDRHRDWSLLAEVAGRHPDLQFVVSSLSEEVRTKPWPLNVTVSQTGSAREVANLYAAAALVVVPLVDNLHASGCTVVIEALSAGIPLVVSDAGGIDEYVQESGGILVPIGDAPAFGAAIRETLSAIASGAPDSGDTYRRRGMTQEDYVRRFVRITDSILGRSAWDERVVRFVAMD